MKNSTLEERLKQGLKRARMKPSTLAREVGISQVAVHKALTGKTLTLRRETCERAAEVLDVSELWLAYGQGPMTRLAPAVPHFDPDQLREWKRKLEAGILAVEALIQMQESQKRSVEARARNQLTTYLDAFAVVQTKPPTKKQSA